MTRIVAGPRFVLEAIVAGTVRRVHVDRSRTRRLEDVLEAARAAGLEVREVSRSDLDELAGGVRHQGVVGTGPAFRFASLDKVLEVPLVVALDEITDPHNAGAILRSAVAFGAAVILPKHRAAGITPVVVRSSAGASEHATIARVTNLQRALGEACEAGFHIVGLVGSESVALWELPSADRRVLVVGSEGKGLRRLVRERCDVLASIPMRGPTESLNASVAIGIALYDCIRPR